LPDKQGTAETGLEQAALLSEEWATACSNRASWCARAGTTRCLHRVVHLLGDLIAGLLRSVELQGVPVVVRCRRFRSVFLSIPIAEASRELRGTRDTTPASCRCCIAGRRGTRYGRRVRFRREVGSSGWAPDLIARVSGQAPCRSRASARGGRIPLVAGWVALVGRSCRPGRRPRHVGSSLAPAWVNPLMAGAFRASSLPARAAQWRRGWRRGSVAATGARGPPCVGAGTVGCRTFARREERDADLRPRGRRLAGDEAGLGVRCSGLGDAMTGINRADSASVKLLEQL